jgi:hypothetical protein
MAIADGGELVILAPGVDLFGEDPAIDMLIRKYGYRGREAAVRAVKIAARVAGWIVGDVALKTAGTNLAENLSAAAHLVHGSSEGRFTVRYCPGENGLSKKEIEKVGYQWGDLEQETARAGDADLVVENPALGLWRVSF